MMLTFEDSSFDQREPERMREREGKLYKCQQSVSLQQALLKINKSVCHLCALLDRHTTVHLGP